jgi:hypothetical protein
MPLEKQITCLGIKNEENVLVTISVLGQRQVSRVLAQDLEHQSLQIREIKREL